MTALSSLCILYILNSFDSNYTLSTALTLSSALTAVTNCQQLWRQFQVVDSCYKRGQLWQLLPALTDVTSIDSIYNLPISLTAATSCRYLWQQLWQPVPTLTARASFDSQCQLRQPVPALTPVASFDSWYKLRTALTAMTSCGQLWQLLKAVDSFNSFYELSTSCLQLLQLCQLKQIANRFHC